MQSRTYNNGKILEYIYTLIPKSGLSTKENVFIDIESGVIINPDSIRLILDSGSEDSFKGVCCDLNESCEGWTTNSSDCWSTASGASWGF